jgi:hypothetical protein
MPAYQSRQRFGENAALVLCFGAVVLAFKFALIAHYGNATPYWDQWDAEAASLYRPWLEGTLRLQDLVAPHNEHRILTTRLLALVLLEAGGRVWNPILQMQVNAVLHVLALSVLLVFLGRPLPLGYRAALFAFAAALYCIPFGWENTLGGFQAQFYFLLLFSFLFLWAMSAYRTGSALWWIGVACGVLSWLSLASGAMTPLAGAGVLLIRRYWFEERDAVAVWPIGLLVALAVAAVATTPALEGTAGMQARSLAQFKEVLLHMLAWPEGGFFFGGPVLQLPLLVSLLVILWKRDMHSPAYLFIVGLAIWLAGQEIALAYGRAAPVSRQPSRYNDLFAVGLVLNFFALLVLMLRSAAGVRYRIALVAALWLGLVAFGFDVAANRYREWLESHRSDGAVQEVNVRRYLCTGDASHLRNKRTYDIPYPDAERLKTLLDDPSIRSVLPGTINAANSSSGDRCRE